MWGLNLLNFDGAVSDGAVVDMGSPASLDNLFATGGGTIMCWIDIDSYGPTNFGKVMRRVTSPVHFLLPDGILPLKAMVGTTILHLDMQQVALLDFGIVALAPYS